MLYKQGKNEITKIEKDFEAYKSSVQLFMPNFHEYMNDHDIRSVLLQKNVHNNYRISNIAEFAFDSRHGYDKMTPNEKLYLFDIEKQIDIFKKKTTFSLREDEHRRAYIDNEKKVSKLRSDYLLTLEHKNKLKEEIDKYQEMLK